MIRMQEIKIIYIYIKTNVKLLNKRILLEKLKRKRKSYFKIYLHILI